MVYKEQAGFRSGYSTVPWTMYFLYMPFLIGIWKDEKEFILHYFVDYRKAFDKI